MDLKDNFILLGKTLGAIIATLTALWFFGEPFLEDYVDGHIKAHEQRLEEADLSKVKWRTLVSNKIGCDEDEAHIKVGKVVREEEEKLNKIWSTLDEDYRYNKEQRNKIVTEIQYIYPGTTLRLE